MTPNVVQSAYALPASGYTSCTLGAAPTPGNLLILFLASGNDAHALLGPRWTLITNGGAGGDFSCQYGLLAYCYVEEGDTTSVPEITTGPIYYNAVAVYEVTGVTGTWASDFDQCEGAYDQTSTTSMAITAMTTAAANELALVFAGQYDAGSNASISSGWETDIAENNSGDYGLVFGASQFFSASSSSVGGTLTIPSSSSPAFYIALLLKVPPTGYILTPEVASFALTGIDVDLTLTTLATYTLTPEPASFVVTQYPILFPDFSLSPITAEFSMAVPVVNLEKDSILAPAKAVFTLTSIATKLEKASILSPVCAVFTLTRNRVNLEKDSILKPTASAFQITAIPILLGVERVLSPLPSAFSLAQHSVTILKASVLAPQTCLFSLMGFPADIYLGQPLRFVDDVLRYHRWNVEGTTRTLSPLTAQFDVVPNPVNLEAA